LAFLPTGRTIGAQRKLRALVAPGKQRVGRNRYSVSNNGVIINVYVPLKRRGEDIECKAAKVTRVKFQMRNVARPERTPNAPAALLISPASRART
jgi:hypothetical protein